jgi:hypothetical protein
MRRAFVAVTTVVLAVALALPAGAQPDPTIDPDDDVVTGHTYVRHDGGTDVGIEHCTDESWDPAPDDDPDDGDLDSNDGGGLRQNNEPHSVIDPTNPNLIVAGSNDYCLTDFQDAWEGFYFSTDGGETWTNSLVPGYRQDTSAEGMASPLFGNASGGDPIAAFDSDGNLFVGGISFNRAHPQNGHVFVSTYLTDPPDWTGGDESLYPVDYVRTVIVGRGTPGVSGVFQDKPMLEVDRTGGQHEGNVYVCWSRFTGNGQNQIHFSRSTDSGEAFSNKAVVSKGKGLHSGQGCDIAISNDGTVHVIWRYIDDRGSKTQNGIGYTRSMDGGVTFDTPRLIQPLVLYFPTDGDRNCGDGPVLCPSEFVFHRVPLEPRVTSDPTGQLPGVYVTYNAVDPDSIVESDTTYSSADANSGLVGQSLVYVLGSTDNGDTWQDPVAVDPDPTGHQYFPDIDALVGRMGVVWQDSRTDPCYSVQLPYGNTADATSCGTSIVNTFFSHSFDGATFASGTPVSDEPHQPQYEMFSNRDLPFQGDYNWIQMAALSDGSVLAYMTWTDNRDVIEGEDPRELEQDGFDVLQCREDLGEGMFGSDTCANAGGLDQNIYGNSAIFATEGGIAAAS